MSVQNADHEMLLKAWDWLFGSIYIFFVWNVMLSLIVGALIYDANKVLEKEKKSAASTCHCP